MEKHTLWLIPSDEVKAELLPIAERYSQQFGTPVPDFHVTLLGSQIISEAAAIAQAEQLASQLSPFPLQLTEVAASTTYFQSVFVRVATTALLLEAHVQAQRAWGVELTVPFMPHISLVYGDLTMSQRAETAAEIVRTTRLGLLPPLWFMADKLWVTPGEGAPDSWYCIKEISFRKS